MARARAGLRADAGQRSAGDTSLAEVKAAWLASDVVYVDRHGEEIQRLRRDKQARRQDWVSLAEMSPALRHALVLSEDRRFYQHSGVDWSGWLLPPGPICGTPHPWRLDADHATGRPAGRRAEGGRWRACLAETGPGLVGCCAGAPWRKAEILEAYLNLVSFRGELVGVGAVSRALFDKLPDG